MTSVTFNPETIETLARTAAQYGLTEIEIRDGDTHLRIRRDPPAPTPPATSPAAPPTATVASPPAAATPAPDDSAPEGAVPSPMVGIAYLAAEPGAAPFITLGQPVTAGQTLLLIEAMKTFNQVKAPTAGTVTRILVTTGQPVEYGQPLVVII